MFTVILLHSVIRYLCGLKIFTSAYREASVFFRLPELDGLRHDVSDFRVDESTFCPFSLMFHKDFVAKDYAFLRTSDVGWHAFTGFCSFCDQFVNFNIQSIGLCVVGTDFSSSEPYGGVFSTLSYDTNNCSLVDRRVYRDFKA
jgi:hypothetical protein